MSVSKAAFFTAVKVTGGPWDPFTQMEDGFEAMRAEQTEHAAGKVLVVHDVPYVNPSEARSTYKQCSDIYLPADAARKGAPLIVHFHGGGWQDGDRADEMFGAPAVGRSHAVAGCVVVAPSYRLGNYNAFMADAQRAILYAVTNAKALGADPNRLYLSGHSAGGNLAALCALGPWLAPPVLPAGAVKGVIGISGVYTLVRPLGGALSCYKNKIFDRYLAKAVFGDEPATLAQHSPTALVRLGGGKAAAFKWRWTEAVGKVAQGTLSTVAITGPKAAADTGGLESVRWGSEVPPVLLINASWDLGLEDDAAYFAKTLAARTGTKPTHHIIPNTNHATVTWDERSHRRCRDFIEACEATKPVV